MKKKKPESIIRKREQTSVSRIITDLEIKIEIPIEPKAKGRPRHSFVRGRSVTYTPSITRATESAIRSYASLAVRGKEPLECPLILEVIFYLKRGKSVKREVPSVKPDYDNLAKILDACNGVLWKDDALIVDSHIYKRYSEKKDGFILLKVYPYNATISLIKHFFT